MKVLLSHISMILTINISGGLQISMAGHMYLSCLSISKKSLHSQYLSGKLEPSLNKYMFVLVSMNLKNDTCKSPK